MDVKARGENMEDQRLYYEDIKEGDEWETLSRTITEADIVNFAGISGDFHPLHMDSEYAKKTIFGERIAHGLLGLAIASGLRIKGTQPEVAFVAFLGLKWNFNKPIKIGDTIRARRKIKEKRETSAPDRGIVVTSIEVLNQKGEMVQQGETTIMVRRRQR
jgi:acyl dehydratase